MFVTNTVLYHRLYVLSSWVSRDTWTTPVVLEGVVLVVVLVVVVSVIVTSRCLVSVV